MFKDVSFWLEIIGACAVVYWVICWLILVSKNESLPNWITKIATIISCLLAFCTVPFSAIFSIPIVINFRNTIDNARHEEFQKAEHLYDTLHKKDYSKGYDKGWRASEQFYKKGRYSLTDDPRDLKYHYDSLARDYCILYQMYSASTKDHSDLDELVTPDFLTLDFDE